jgi:hypothetical protein
LCGAEKVAKQKSKQSQPKRTRINWSKEPHLAKLRKAVDDWNTKAGDWKPTDRLAEFAQRVGIAVGTLSQYVTVAGGQPKLQVGAGSVGRPSYCSEQQQQFVADTIRRADRGNKGKTRQQAVDIVQELQPDLDRSQAANVLDKTIRHNHSSELTGIVKTQETTTKRSAITIEQQWRWHSEVDAALAEQLKLNVDDGSGVLFERVSEHFFWN